MKREVIGIAMALGLLSVSPAFAAGETTDLHVPPQTKVDVREWVVKNKPKAYRFTVPVAVGATIPQDVELVAVPETWGPALRPYRYVYADDRVYLVQPSSRQVVYIID